MDRALQERITGAIVLVVFIVLVVPVFLDGPAEEPGVVTESVTLPGQNGQERKRQTIVLERDRSEPVPAAARPAAEESAAPAPREAPPATIEESNEAPVEATPAVDEPAPAVVDTPQSTPPAEEPPASAPPQPEPEPASAESSATGMWAVQLGSFSNKANAERLAAELRGQGYAAFLSRHEQSGREMHRVRIGPQKDRASAEQTASRLAGAGHRGQVVPHP